MYLRLAQEALHRAGIDNECEALPWRRAQMIVQLGEQDAMITLATAERAEYSVAIEEPLYHLPLHAFTRVSHPRREELARLRHASELQAWQVLSYLGDGWAQSQLEPAGVSVAWSRDLATVLNQPVRDTRTLQRRATPCSRLSRTDRPHTLPTKGILIRHAKD